MTCTGCCASVKSGDDLKKTRSWDSTPARTVDCVGRRKFESVSLVVSERLGICWTYHDCRCLVCRKPVLRDAFCPLSHFGIPFFKKSATVKEIWMQELSPDESCIDESSRIVGSTNWFLDRRHTAWKDERRIEDRRITPRRVFLTPTRKRYLPRHEHEVEGQVQRKHRYSKKITQ